MKILLVNHYAGSPDLGMEFRPYYMSIEWIKKGHEVLIVGATYSHLRKNQPQVGQQKKDGINYLWIKTNTYKGNGFGRIFSMFSFVFKLCLKIHKIVKNFHPDVVIASSTYPLDIYPAQRIARQSNAKLVFEVHDLWPLSPLELGGYSKYHPFILTMQLAENYAYKHCNKVISILPCAKNHMIEHGLKKDKFYHIPNGIVLKDWKNPKRLPEEHQSVIYKLQNEGKFLIGFAGAHGVANSLNSIIDATAKLINRKVILILIGAGQEKEKLISYVKKSNFKNIYFLDPIDKSAIPTFLKQMDVLFIGLKKRPLFKFGISPNKLFDYMMASKPIIQAIDAGNNLVKEANCGLCVEPGNSDAIADAIIRLQSLSEGARKKLGENGNKFVHQYHTYNNLALKFIEVMA